jgi:hypothetical protein
MSWKYYHKCTGFKSVFENVRSHSKSNQCRLKPILSEPNDLKSVATCPSEMSVLSIDYTALIAEDITYG